jgi:hypothetical protein
MLEYSERAAITRPHHRAIITSVIWLLGIKTNAQQMQSTDDDNEFESSDSTFRVARSSETLTVPKLFRLETESPGFVEVTV